MKNLIVTAAVAAALASPAAFAQSRAGASAEEIRLLREQLNALTERLNRLEAQNADLAASNEQLKAEAGKATELEEQVQQIQTDSDATLEQLAKTRAGLPEWASRFTFRGDLRYRHEQIDSGDDRQVAGTPPSQFPPVNSLDRDRDRIRFRFGGSFKVNDTVLVAMTIATGADDPRSSNQTLGGEQTRKAIGLDQAYFEWNPNTTWRLRGGKLPQPWIRPGQSLFFDGDINPEGVSVGFNRGYFSATGWYLWMQERGPTVPVQGQGQIDKSDPAMGGAQFAFRYPFTATSNLSVGLGYYDHFATQGRRPFYNGNPNGNTTVNVPNPPPAGTPPVAVALYDYNILQAFATYDRVVFDTLPFSVFVDYAQNDDGQYDTAYGVGAFLGRASNPGTWEVGAMYQKIEKDALFGQWVDSDFGNGNTDTKGWVLRAGYAPLRNVVLNATYFINDLNVDVFNATNPKDRSYDRLQLDANFRF